MPLSAFSQQQKPIMLQITEPVFGEKCEKIISHECEWAFSYQLFAVKPHAYG
jgi:hypothetical protein